MQQVFPSYYKAFHCIGSRCRHSCCIGWEIDIDPDTAAVYRATEGALGRRLGQHIAYTNDTAHFVTDEHGRCPFLNDRNLCDIILELGEPCLCEICTDHPRFRNELPGRTEVGLGLCCEEAARIILGNSEPSVLVDAPETDDEIILLRDRVIGALQDRSRTMEQRIDEMLTLCNTALPEAAPSEWIRLLLSLERLEDSWSARLLAAQTIAPDFDGFNKHMAERQTEYEQFVVYAVYRHFANAADAEGVAARAALAALFFHLLHLLGAAYWTQHGSFTFEDQVELARGFSAEIEYSDENLYTLLDML